MRNQHNPQESISAKLQRIFRPDVPKQGGVDPWEFIKQLSLMLTTQGAIHVSDWNQAVRHAAGKSDGLEPIHGTSTTQLHPESQPSLTQAAANIDHLIQQNLLERFPEVTWDRYIENPQGEFVFYGWIARQDQYKDFILVRLDRAGNWQWYTSSAKYSPIFAERINPGGIHIPCQRITDRWPTLQKAVKK